MTMHICGPSRFATGLLTLKGSNNADKFMTWNNLDSDSGVDSYVPDISEFPKKTIYHKTHYDISDFTSFKIVMTAGDVMHIEGETYDGEHIYAPISATGSLEIRPMDYGIPKSIKEGKAPDIEVVEISESEKMDKISKRFAGLTEGKNKE